MIVQFDRGWSKLIGSHYGAHISRDTPWMGQELEAPSEQPLQPIAFWIGDQYGTMLSVQHKQAASRRGRCPYVYCMLQVFD